jgi:[acyl-carrier-protein] S-malonyltransferase
LEAANFNAPDQTVVSGHVPAVRRLIEDASRIRRCKAVLLPVSSAFHTRLMEPALQALSERLKKVEPRPFRFPVLANATGRPYEQPEQIKHLLLEQLVSPVRWTACMETLLGSGATHFMEIGPARVLTGLLKRINRRAVAVTIGTPDEIQSVTEPSA